jgi:hypothetical protein
MAYENYKRKCHDTCHSTLDIASGKDKGQAGSHAIGDNVLIPTQHELKGTFKSSTNNYVHILG